MEEPATQRRSIVRPLAWGVSLLVAVPVLYFLSVGPAAWLRVHGYLSETMIEIAYAPLGWLRDSCPALDPLLDWYVHLFVQ